MLPSGNERRTCEALNTTVQDPGPLREYCNTPSLPSSGISTCCELNNFVLVSCALGALSVCAVTLRS